MTARMKTIAMGVTLIVTSGILFAAEDALHPCAHVRNDTDRLACYDQAFGKPAASTATTPPRRMSSSGSPKRKSSARRGQSAETAAADQRHGSNHVARPAARREVRGDSRQRAGMVAVGNQFAGRRADRGFGHRAPRRARLLPTGDESRDRDARQTREVSLSSLRYPRRV